MMRLIDKDEIGMRQKSKEIYRPDWGKGDHRGTAGPVPGQTVGRNAVTIADAAHPVPASTGSGESALPDATLEMAGAAGDNILEAFGCPDPEGFQEELMKLPQADIDLLCQVLAHSKSSDHPYDIAVAYEKKATIHQLLRAKALVRQMPDRYRSWLRGVSSTRNVHCALRS
jgi:hypothetical protein